MTLTVAGHAPDQAIHMGDTQETIALAFADELNHGYMSFWAQRVGECADDLFAVDGAGWEFDYGDRGDDESGLYVVVQAGLRWRAGWMGRG